MSKLVEGTNIDSEPQRSYKNRYNKLKVEYKEFTDLMQPPYQKKVRLCIKCKKTKFISDGPHNRICSYCNKENEKIAKLLTDTVQTFEDMNI